MRDLLHGRAHECLRSETRSLHQALDASMLPLSDLANRQDYIRYLSMNSPCAAIEEALESAGVHHILSDWNCRRRRFDLTDDLFALGVALPPSRGLQIANDTAAILGWSYVLEGSRLGASVILRKVEVSAPAEIRAATRFLRHGLGENYWNSFKIALARIDADPESIAVACEGAREAFECFLGSFAGRRSNAVPT
jgi:heme oxygenase (biliverdin-IX-beta and delta-forming)